MTPILIAVLIVIFRLLLVHWLWAKKKVYRELTSKLTTAHGLPFFGVAFKILPFTRFLYGIAAQFEQYETLTYCAWLGMEPFVITIEPEVIRRVLTCEDFLNKSASLYECVDHAIPNGIIASLDQKWKHNRRLINSSFSFKILTSFVPAFNRGSRQICEYFESLVDKGEQHEILQEIQRIIFEMGIETNMGFKLNKDNEEDRQFYLNFKKLIDNIAKDAVFATLNLKFLIRNAAYYRNNRNLRNYIAKRITLELAKRRDNEKNVVQRKEIFLQRALNLMENQQFDIEDIISESHTLIAGSFETISTTIYSTLVMLAMHPEVQEKLFEEIKLTLEENDNDIDMEMLKHLSYLDMVLNETLRLMPSIPTIGRVTTKTSQLKDDLDIPANVQVIIPIFALHRSKVLWGPNADQFCPDNFYPENVAQRHAYAYMPFSKGPRNCIGWQFGIIALKICLTGIVRNYKFSTNYKYEDLKFVHQVSIKYHTEPALIIEKRY